MAILVAYDGSRPAQNAVERAVTQHPDEEIVLLRVVEAADGVLEAGVGVIREELKELRDEVATELDEEVADLLEHESVDYRVETAVGEPAREIVAYAEEHDVEEIIVGSHGREGVSRYLLGNVAEKVVRRAPTVVTVVR